MNWDWGENYEREGKHDRYEKYLATIRGYERGGPKKG
jgi:hypothetical protein